MDEVKVLDTYALCEILQANPKFLHYSEENIVIPDLILVEFYDVIMRNYNEEIADLWFNKFLNYSVNIPIENLIKAVKFRRKYAKKNLSFFDAAGYIYALENNYKFVTGDKEFEHLENVEFLKK